MGHQPDGLLTERLSLREFADADFDALRAIDADPEVQRFRSRAAIAAEDTRAFLAQAQAQAAEQPRQQYAFAIVLRADGRLAGLCGLTIVNSRYDEAYLWYAIGRRDWGLGYATEAAGRLLRFGFDAARLRRIFAECGADNPASARVLEKIGMTPETVSTGEPVIARLRYGMARSPSP